MYIMNVRSLPPNVLIQICISLLDEESFDYDDPFDDFDDNEKLIRNASAWASSNVEREDVEFISKFISDNLPLLESVKNDGVSAKSIIPELSIPSLKSYKVYYEIWGPATLTEKYRVTWESYDEDWVKPSLRRSYYDGDFDYYQGDYLEYETDNFESDNFEITDVDSINESKKTLLSKVVVENTTDVLDSLDKDTLLRLRNIINQKLSSF